MVDVDSVIINELGLLAPLGGFEGADWGEVVRRARTIPGTASSQRKRRLAAGVVFAALVVVAVAVSPLGAAIGRGFGDWLSGHPGAPASRTARNAFAAATHSWYGFPRHAALRSLIVHSEGGLTAKLYGFRTSDALCLRLVVSGSASGVDLACAPLSELRARKQPALVLSSDFGVGVTKPVDDGPLVVSPPQAAITIGIVADGVRRVEIGSSNGTTSQATVQADSFLSIALRPSPELRVTHVWATRNGKRTAIPFEPATTPLHALFPVGRTRKPAGPSKVDRLLRSGAISWFARREPRGKPLSASFAHLGLVAASPKVIFARVVAPDPQAPGQVVISLLPAGRRFYGGRLPNNNEVCAELVGGVYSAGRSGGGGCWPAGRLFSTGPFTESVTQGRNNQYVTIVGLASDDVARLRLYVATGEYVPVPLRDNAYIAEASLAKYPLRLVAYDREGRVIGTRILQGNAGGPAAAAPAQGAAWHTVIRNAGGTLMTAPSSTGSVCFAVHFKDGGAMIGCPPPLPPRSIAFGSMGGRQALAVSGRTGADVTQVVIRFRDGTSTQLQPVGGYILARFQGKQVRDLLSVTGLDRNGKTLTTERFR